MKDFVPKGTGNSRFLRSVSNFLSLYPTYEAFASALTAGTLPVDFAGVNSDGITQMGTSLNKANLLTDATATALGLSGDPTVDQALYALSKKKQAAQVHVLATSGAVVTMIKGNKTLTATAGSDGWAIFYPAEFGNWTIKSGSYTKVFNVNAIAVLYVAVTPLEALNWNVVASCAKNGLAKSLWQIGDKKTLTLNNVTYTAVIIGFDHDNVANAETYGRSKAGITWQLLDCLQTSYPMNSSNTNIGGWKNSVMRTSTMVTLLEQLPTALKSNIVPVTKSTSTGNMSLSAEGTTDSLFLLSEIEIFGAVVNSFLGEGNQYEYYTAGNSLLKHANGYNQSWWQRSPGKNDVASFCRVHVFGTGSASTGNATTSFFVSFGFCI